MACFVGKTAVTVPVIGETICPLLGTTAKPLPNTSSEKTSSVTFLPRWGEEAVTVRADPGLMKQVMRILMDNAVKYSPDTGRVYLRVSESQGHARVTVQDEGMGIPPEGIPHIFERFYRTDQSRDRKTGGTGLGLAIARWIVERHGGWFEVVSRPDVGTRIAFLIPLAPEEPGGKEPEAA